MKNSYKTITIFVVLLILGFISINVLQSEPPFRAKERIDQLKKIKLLDLLQLDEQRSSKFLTKYNELERQSKENRLEMEHEVEILELLINSEANIDEISSQTDKVIAAQQRFYKSIDNKLKDIKPLLNEIEYAKFVFFESRFHEEVRKIIMKNYRNRHEGRNFRNKDNK